MTEIYDTILAKKEAVDKSAKKVEEEIAAFYKKIDNKKKELLMIKREQDIYDDILSSITPEKSITMDRTGQVSVDMYSNYNDKMSFSDMLKEVLDDHEGWLTIREIAEEVSQKKLSCKPLHLLLDGLFKEAGKWIAENKLESVVPVSDGVKRYRRKPQSPQKISVKKKLADVCKEILTISPGEKLTALEIADLIQSSGLWPRDTKNFRDSIMLCMKKEDSGINHAKIQNQRVFWVD